MRKEHNKIDDFFKNKLDPIQIENEDWNNPSDNLWNKAQSKFEVRTRKKKRYFFVLFPLLLCIGCVSLCLILVDKETISGLPVIVNQDQITSITSQPKNSAKSDYQEIPNNTKHNASSTSQPKDLNQLVNPKSNNSKQETSIKSALIVLSQNEKTQDIDQKRRTDSKEQIGIETPLYFLPQSKKSENKHAIINATNSESPFNNNILENVQPIVDIGKIDIALIQSNNESNNKNLKLSKILLIKPLNNRIAISSKKTYQLPSPIIPMAKVSSKKGSQEVGIDYFAFALPFILSAVEIEDENPQSSYSYEGKYRNIGGSYSKWIGDKWSIQTGLQFTKLEVDINFDIFDSISTDNLEEINKSIDDLKLRNKGSDDAANSIILNTGEKINIGDVINLKGNVSLGLNVIQLPILLNRHFYKKKSEFSIGIGASLDYLYVRQSSLAIELNKEDRQIGNLDAKSQNETFIGGSVYTKFGYRYHFNKHINVGTALRISVLEPEFSGLEFGIYYRWH